MEAVAITMAVSRGNALRFVLLSGPNMGGKSTLARAVGLTVVLAQVGARPASEYVLTPIHQLVVRCGTLRDDLRAGVSTFRGNAGILADSDEGGEQEYNFAYDYG